MWTYNYTDELYHYGVKGMKWGVRRYKKYDGPHRGLKKRRAKKAQKILTRLDEMNNDHKRKERMNDRQKQSYRNAKEYWQAVEKSGLYRGNKVGDRTLTRNMVIRSHDAHRSRSIGERTVVSQIPNALLIAGQMYMYNSTNKKLGVSVDINAADIGQKFVRQTIGFQLEDEITNKIFGHF